MFLAVRSGSVHAPFVLGQLRFDRFDAVSRFAQFLLVRFQARNGCRMALGAACHGVVHEHQNGIRCTFGLEESCVWLEGAVQNVQSIYLQLNGRLPANKQTSKVQAGQITLGKRLAER